MLFQVAMTIRIPHDAEQTKINEASARAEEFLLALDVGFRAPFDG
jgi:muconolactone delta-isomerase